MHRFGAALFALWVTQQEPAPAAPPELVHEPPGQPAPPTPPAAPTEAPAPSEPPPVPVAPAGAPRREPASVAPRAPATVRPQAPAPVPTPPPRPGPVPPPAQLAPTPSAPRPAPAAPQSDRERALRAALAFAEALLRSDASGLAAASTGTFSFDGEPVAGRDAQMRRWAEIFAERIAGAASLRDLALLEAADALAQLGPPPARIAAVVKAGAWIAVADLSGRPVVLVIVQEGGRFAVAAMHD